jgi:hypothetical protein
VPGNKYPFITTPYDSIPTQQRDALIVELRQAGRPFNKGKIEALYAKGQQAGVFK